MTRIGLSLGVFITLTAVTARADVQIFLNDYPGFAASVGALSNISFATLPDGTPSFPGDDITDTFNYDAYGVHFTATVGRLFITGGQNRSLKAEARFLETTALQSDFLTPVYAVGALFEGDPTLCAYGADNQLLACETGSSILNGFIGFVSDEPIYRTLQSRNAQIEVLEDMYYAPIPEPTTLILFGLGYSLLTRRRASANVRNTTQLNRQLTSRPACGVVSTAT